MALIHCKFFSETLQVSTSMDVILPQEATGQIGMESSKSTGEAPCLWLLHGMSDDHTIWQRRTSIERYVAPLGLAVVMPAPVIGVDCTVRVCWRKFIRLAPRGLWALQGYLRQSVILRV